MSSLPPSESGGAAPSGPRSRVAVTVVVTSFGRREFLLEAVRSVLGQSASREVFEILVVKDFADPPIDAELVRCGAVTIRGEGPNHGKWLVTALERGRGQLFVFLDDDDRMLPDRLATIARVWESDRSLAFYHNGVVPIGPNGERTPTVPSEIRKQRLSGRLRVVPGDRRPRTLRRLWEAGAAFNLSSIAVDVGLLRSSAPFLRRIRASSSAFLLFAALSGSGTILVDPTVLTEYRVHPGNLSAVVAPSTELRWQREARRAKWVTEDCDVALELLRSRGTAPSIGRRLELTRLRYGLLLSLSDPATPVHSLLRRMARLTVASVPGYLGGTVAYLRLGVRVVLARVLSRGLAHAPV